MGDILVGLRNAGGREERKWWWRRLSHRKSDGPLMHHHSDADEEEDHSAECSIRKGWFRYYVKEEICSPKA